MAKRNEVEKYLDDHRTTAYMVAKLANVSKSTMYDAINASRNLDNQTVAIIKAVAKAVNRKPGQVLDRLIEIENDSDLEFNPLSAYKFYLGLLTYLVDDFKVRKHQASRPSFRLSNQDTALYIKMFFSIRSILQWLVETFGDQIVSELLVNNELSLLFKVKQKPINFERIYEDKNFNKFFHKEHEYEISILSLKDINIIFQFLISNISDIKKQISGDLSKDVFEDLKIKNYGIELRLSIYNDLVDLIRSDSELSIEDLKSDIIEIRDSWIKKAKLTPNLKIITYACTEIDEFEIEPLSIYYLPKEIRNKYAFSLPKVESFLTQNNYNFIHFNAVKNKIEITDDLTDEWFEYILDDLDFDNHEEWLAFIDEVDFESYKKYIYSLSNKSYDNIFEATKIYQR